MGGHWSGEAGIMTLPELVSLRWGIGQGPGNAAIGSEIGGAIAENPQNALSGFRLPGGVFVFRVLSFQS